MRNVANSDKSSSSNFSSSSSSSSSSQAAGGVGGTTASASASTSTAKIEPPTSQQLRRVFVHAAIPMIGFGFMDQTVMVQAGNAIDCTIGVIFGLSTLTAAAIGQVCSDASGILFGGTVERVLKYTGILSRSLQLSAQQMTLPVVSRTTLAGNFFGIIFGCSLGLINLLFIDTTRSSTLKLQASYEDELMMSLSGGSGDPEHLHHYEGDPAYSNFTVEISNAVRPDITALTIEGPDVDGVIANMTLALALQNCSVLEITSKSYKDGHQSTKGRSHDGGGTMKAVIHVVNRTTNEQFDDEELEDLATKVLEATRTPVQDINALRYTINLSKLQPQPQHQQLQQHQLQQQLPPKNVIGNNEKSPPPPPSSSPLSSLHEADDERETMEDMDTIRNSRKHKEDLREQYHLQHQHHHHNQRRRHTRPKNETSGGGSSSFQETYNKLQRRMTIVKAAHGVGGGGGENDGAPISKKELLRRRITIVPNKDK